MCQLKSKKLAQRVIARGKAPWQSQWDCFTKYARNDKRCHFKLIISFVLLLLLVSCGKKKESPESLTPLNAGEKYGEVMGKAMKKSQAMDDILYLKDKINAFQIQFGKYPSSLDELVEKGIIEKLPEPPKGMRFVYDPRVGGVEVK